METVFRKTQLFGSVEYFKGYENGHGVYVFINGHGIYESISTAPLIESSQFEESNITEFQKAFDSANRAIATKVGSLESPSFITYWKPSQEYGTESIVTYPGEKSLYEKSVYENVEVYRRIGSDGKLLICGFVEDGTTLITDNDNPNLALETTEIKLDEFCEKYLLALTNLGLSFNSQRQC